jgi:hypothetical protein
LGAYGTKKKIRHMSRTKKAPKRRRRKNGRLRDRPVAPLIGYMRVSKADGSQVLDLQRDALLMAGVKERHLYSDTSLHAYRRSGRTTRSLSGSWPQSPAPCECGA